MPQRHTWSREQLIIAFKLYCEMPFGRMHSHNPEIVRYSKLIGRTPSALAMKLTNIASLDPEIRSTGRKGLSASSKADKDMWDEMTSDWNHFCEEIALTERKFHIGPTDKSKASQESPADDACYVGETRTAQIEARIGQGLFRRAVLSAYAFRCCITGLDVPELLVASHIRPWRLDPKNRLNPRNGLCLSPLHDRAFDLGFLTISDDYCLLLSSRFCGSNSDSYMGRAFCNYADKPISMPEKFPPDPEFLRYHRENIFHK